MTRRLLMIAFHFPPMTGSSGIQRTLRFVQHLPRHGWQPLVLSAAPRVYHRSGDDLLNDIPDGAIVERAFALDAARHLAIAGRYPGFLARPDRYVSWWPFGVLAAMKLIRRHRPHAIWSTYPIATAHLIGASVARLSRMPWIADFRDPMAQEGYPEDPATWRAFERIERRAVQRAAASVFTTPSAVRTYRARYPDHADRIHLIENGYDEESFAGIRPQAARDDDKWTLLHSGIVYPSERDPTQLFAALAELARTPAHPAARLRIRFRAAVHEDLLRELAQRYAVSDRIEIAPPVPYRDALAEMTGVDALLILQAANCNEQIPGKLYEYLRAGRPVVGFTDPAGDTGRTLADGGTPYIGALNDAAAIVGVLRQLGADLAAARPVLPRADVVRAASREARSAQLAALLDSVCAR